MYATVIREKPKLSPRIDGSSLNRLIRRLMDSGHIEYCLIEETAFVIKCKRSRSM